MKNLVAIFVITITGLGVCCFPLTSGSDRYRLDDPELAPFSAMYEVDREQFCLTDIDKNAEVEIERDKYATSGYHVMLHMYSGNVTRYVAFVQKAGRYVWVGEQENHTSGHRYRTIDGEDEEIISISYFREKLTRYDSTGLNILYSGDYNSVNFTHPFELTCEEVLPYIRKWDSKTSTTQE